MGKSLAEIVQNLKNIRRKVTLIYAFNGVGKTRLSSEFKQLSSARRDNEEREDDYIKFLYYNAFTEDLFYWDNDLVDGIERKLIIRPNAFTEWVLKEEGKENDITRYFQLYTNSKLSPKFNEDFSEVTFSFMGGNSDNSENVKISRSEESHFIWCIFYTILELVADELGAEEENRSTSKFNQLEYVFIDDPVTSLDENHLIEIAVNLAQLIITSKSDLKFIITTHNTLFYNVLHNEFNNRNKDSGYNKDHSKKYRLEKNEDGTYKLEEQNSDSPFSYHLYLLKKLKKDIDSDEIQKYHFNLLRNVLEKTSTFLGYTHWKGFLDRIGHGELAIFYSRMINISSHSKIPSDEVPVLSNDDKDTLKSLVNKLIESCHFKLDNPNSNIGD